MAFDASFTLIDSSFETIHFELFVVLTTSQLFIQLQHRYQFQDAKEIATHLLQSLEIFLPALSFQKGSAWSIQHLHRASFAFRCSGENWGDSRGRL